jgi:MFS family permease
LAEAYVKFTFVIGLAGLSGAAIACAVATLALIARGDFHRDEAITLWPSPLAIVAGWGAFIGITIALLSPYSPLNAWMRGTVGGIAFGVITVGAVAGIIAAWLAGPSSKGLTGYLPTGLWFGIPVGIIIGLVAGRRVYRQQLRA